MNARAQKIVDVNLLPREQRPPEVSSAALLLGSAALVAVAVLVPLSAGAHAARSDASAIGDRARVAESGLHDVQVGLARQRARSGDLERAKTELFAAVLTRQKLRGGSRPLHEDFAALYGPGFLTAGMRVTAVAGTVDGLRVDGVAPGPFDAIAYADKLATSGGFPSARVEAFAPAAKSGGQFTIEVKR